MKKSLLTLAACAMLASSADAMYLVGDPAGNWSPAIGIEMTESDGGWKWTGTIGEDQWYAFATQLLESGDWDTFNSTYRLNPSENGLVASDGDYQLVLGGKDNAFKGSGLELTYFIAEKDGAYTLTVSDPSGVEKAPMYLIGAPAGEWGTNIGIKMTPVDGGWKWSGNVPENDYFAFATELVEPETVENPWDVFNEKFRLSPDSGDGTAAAVGEYALHFGEPSGAFHGTGNDATYFVREADGVYTLVVTEEGGVALPQDAVWGVVGSFNAWGDEPDFTMTKIRDGVWKATMYDFSGEFKFRADSAWEFDFGAAEDGLIEADGVYSAALQGANFNIAEPVEEVIFELDVIHKTLTVKGLSEVSLALRGSMNEWEFDSEYGFQEVDDNVFMLYLDYLAAGSEFKVADENWSEEYTTAVLNMEPGEMYELLPGAGQGNMGVDKSYIDAYLFFDLDNMMFWLEGDVDNSVAANEIATGKARYYNLQGVEVSNPSAGIFVRVVNGRSQKVTVK